MDVRELEPASVRLRSANQIVVAQRGKRGAEIVEYAPRKEPKRGMLFVLKDYVSCVNAK